MELTRLIGHSEGYNTITLEVKSIMTKPDIPKGLKRFLDRCRNTENAYVLNEKLTADIQYNSCKIKFIAFESFATTAPIG